MAEFDIGLERLCQVSDDMLSEMGAGLRGDDSSLLMIPTYVHKLPTQQETGEYLALDFGGSTCRLILVTLRAGRSPVTVSQTFTLDNELKRVPGNVLFDHLAQYTAEFVIQNGLQGKSLPLGFTFSFPMSQSSVNKGRLLRWTKGYSNEGVIGENVAELLEEALSKDQYTRGITVAALANDTAGTLMAGATQYNHCHAGLILGTGTNAAYTEKVDNVSSLKGCQEEDVIINIEWGNFGTSGHLSDLFTTHDTVLDNNSNNPGKQIFEKMLGGLYIGELVRLALVHRAESGEISIAVEELSQSLDGAAVSQFISNDDSIRTMYSTATEQDIAVIQGVCSAVSKRAAHLAAAGVAAIWRKLGSSELLVAVDGSVFIKHPTFAAIMRDALVSLGCTAKLDIATDGSGAGSALIAASTVA